MTDVTSPPPRCPGHTCDLGRTQDWIKGAGKIDGKYSDLPPDHFWYADGSYLAHSIAMEQAGAAAAADGASLDDDACYVTVPATVDRTPFRCTRVAGHDGDHVAHGSGTPPLTWTGDGAS